jgi:hypothetical protein
VTWDGVDRRRFTPIARGERYSKSWRAEQFKRLLLASGATVIQDEIKDGIHLYSLKLDERTYLFVSKSKGESNVG